MRCQGDSSAPGSPYALQALRRPLRPSRFGGAPLSSSGGGVGGSGGGGKHRARHGALPVSPDAAVSICALLLLVVAGCLLKGPAVSAGAGRQGGGSGSGAKAQQAGDDGAGARTLWSLGGRHMLRPPAGPTAPAAPEQDRGARRAAADRRLAPGAGGKLSGAAAGQPRIAPSQELLAAQAAANAAGAAAASARNEAATLEAQAAARAPSAPAASTRDAVSTSAEPSRTARRAAAAPAAGARAAAGDPGDGVRRGEKTLAGGGTPVGAQPSQVAADHAAARSDAAAQAAAVRAQLLASLGSAARTPSAKAGDMMTAVGADPLAGLAEYYTAQLPDAVPDWAAAAARQARPGAQEAGLERGLADPMDELTSLPARLAFVAELMASAAAEAPCELALHATWGGDTWGLRRELLPWLQYHAALGVSRLYLLYDGQDAAVERALSALPRVEVMLAGGALAAPEEAADFAAYTTRADNHGGWLGRPGDYDTMVKQAYGVTRALNVAREDGAEWLISLNPDELLSPDGDGGFSLAPELCDAPAHVPAVRFMNAEAVPEAGWLANPFEQVTLFRGHRHMASADAAPWRGVFKQGHNAAWLNLYINGKSAVRVDAPGVHQGGPHLFTGPPNPRWATPTNPGGAWTPRLSSGTVLLHYAYTRPGDVMGSPMGRCTQQAAEAALTGDFLPASRCFLFDLDLRAYLVAIGVPHAKAATALAAPPVAANGPPQLGGSRSSRALRLGHGDESAAPGSGTARGSGAARAATAAAEAAVPRVNGTWLASNAEDFLFGELVLSEGAPFACAAPDAPDKLLWCSMRGVRRLKHLLLGARLLAREHGPQQVLRGQEAVVRQRLAGQVRDGAGAAASDAADIGGVPAGRVAAQQQQPQQQQQQQQQTNALTSSLPPGQAAASTGASASLLLAAPAASVAVGIAPGTAAIGGVRVSTVELPSEVSGAPLVTEDAATLAAT